MIPRHGRTWCAILESSPPARSRKIELRTCVRAVVLAAILGAALGWWLP